MRQRRMGFECLRDDAGRAVTVDVCGVRDKGKQVAIRIRHDMALATLCVLARIEAARPTAFGRLRRLAVDDASRRRRVSIRKNA